MNDNNRWSMEEYERFRYVVENIRDIIWEIDTNLVFTYITSNSKDMCGYEPDELIGKPMPDFLTQGTKDSMMEKWKTLMKSKRPGDMPGSALYDVEFICKGGRIIWAEVSTKPVFRNNTLVGYAGTTRDISEKKEYQQELNRYIEELKNTNCKLEELANFDTLTGAYNRRRFEEYFKASVDIKEKYDSTFSIIMFDIDNFKQINDTFGHNEGDHILRGISTTVKFALRETDKLFRWGGDEFIVLLPSTALKDALKVAEKIRSTVEHTELSSRNAKITISLGVGEYSNGDSVYQYVSRVDNAMLRAKNTGRNKAECCY